LSDARESTKKFKKGIIKELFSEIEVFHDISHSKDMDDLKKDRENLENMVDD